jgi:hypothetical protein
MQLHRGGDALDLCMCVHNIRSTAKIIALDSD